MIHFFLVSSFLVSNVNAGAPMLSMCAQRAKTPWLLSLLFSESMYCPDPPTRSFLVDAPDNGWDAIPDGDDEDAEIWLRKSPHWFEWPQAVAPGIMAQEAPANDNAFCTWVRRERWRMIDTRNARGWPILHVELYARSRKNQLHVVHTIDFFDYLSSEAALTMEAKYPLGQWECAGGPVDEHQHIYDDTAQWLMDGIIAHKK